MPRVAIWLRRGCLRGMARLREMVAGQIDGTSGEEVEVLVGIGTDRGLWVLALVAAGYAVFGVNSL